MNLKKLLYLIGRREYVKERIDPIILIGVVFLDIVLIISVFTNINTSLFTFFLGICLIFTVCAGLWIHFSIKNVKARLKKREKLIKEGEKFVGQIITFDTTKVKGIYTRKYYNVLVKFEYKNEERLVWSEELDFYPGELKTSRVDVYVLNGEYIITHFR